MGTETFTLSHQNHERTQSCLSTVASQPHRRREKLRQLELLRLLPPQKLLKHQQKKLSSSTSMKSMKMEAIQSDLRLLMEHSRWRPEMLREMLKVPTDS